MFAVLFAYLKATAYLGASLYYMFETRNYGTPFRNSLTPVQLKIKKEAVGKRYRLLTGLIISVVLLMIIDRSINVCKNFI